MIVGTPKEIKNHEYRVGLTPAGAHTLVAAGHGVMIERNAGTRVGLPDSAYAAAGATVIDSAAEIFARADMIVKVKELQPEEYALTRAGQILFCYHHFAPNPQLAAAMIERGNSCVAYETVTDVGGGLPLLAPMSRIAGRLAPQMGAWSLQMANGGSGVLLGGVPGVPPAKVVIIGAGTVGAHAAQIAVGMGAEVTLIDRGTARLESLDRIYRGRIKTCVSEPLALADHVADADMVIGAVLIPGKLTPRLITRELLRRMRPGSVLVDVSIDQGGIAQTSRPTTHTNPIYVEEGVVHYCVGNMPGACARTATLAITHASLPYAARLADLGLRDALLRDPALRQGLQIHRGQVTHAGLAQELQRPFIAPETALEP